MNFEEYATTTIVPFTSSGLDNWTVDDAMKGVSIMGGTGSGKTTASGRALARKYLKEGWGGLVLCAKSDEATQWQQYCEDTGRADDCVIFGKGKVHDTGPFAGQEMVFNPIDYEMKREGQGAGDTQNLTNIFMNIYRMGNRIAHEGDTKEERFWDTALKRCLNRTIELLKVSGENLSYQNMVKIISTSAGVDIDRVSGAVKEIITDNQVWNKYKGEEDYCLYCLIRGYFVAEKEPPRSENNMAFDAALIYFTQAFHSMGKRTRSIITESFMGLAEPFLSGLLYRHFSGATNIFPEQTYGYNKYDLQDTRKLVIVLDFGIKEYLDMGIMAQCAFKLMFQQAIERRNVNKFPTPVFLWCDEAQYFVNPYDQIFLTTARSSRTATVYLSQNISNYFAIMGSGEDATARVNSLMGNLSTKIFHANSDARTNEYASQLIGYDIAILNSAGVQHPHFGLDRTESEQSSSQYLPQVQPKEFTVLKTGGPINNYKVQAIVTTAGREWSQKKNYLRVTFTQKF